MCIIRNSFKLLILIALVVAPTAAQNAAASLSRQVSLVTEFDVNGLKVLVKRRAASPTVAVGLFVRGGVKNLTAQTAGIEDFTLDVATEASRKFPREQLRRELARTGAAIGSSTTYDYSALSMATPRAAFDRSWEIFTDIALNPSFTPEDAELVRERTLTGLRERASDPDAYLEVLSREAAFVNHPYASAPEGTIESVSRLKPEDLRRYHASLMQTSRLLLIVVGDLDAAQVRAKAEAAFGKLPRGNYQDKPAANLNFTAPTVAVTTRALPTNYIQGVFSAPAPSDPDVYAMRVATAILRDRVFEEVRVKRNLSYAPNASLENRQANVGSIYVSAVDANQAVTVMLGEIQRLQNETVSGDEIEAVVGQYLTTYYLGQETNVAQAADLAANELIGGGWRNSFGFLDKIRQVQSDDVKRVARAYMRNIRFVVLGDPNDINRQIFTKL